MNQLKNKIQIFLLLLFVGFVGWWISFQHVLSAQGQSTVWFGRTYGGLALIGAIVGYIASRKWGGHKTILGKALLFFSIGLLAQEAGQLIFVYYINFAHIEIPYPSWGDVAYFGSTLSYILGGIFLAKSVGVKFSLKSKKYKVIAFAVPAILLAASYWVFLHHHQFDWHNPISVFLDIGYPLGDALYISFGLIAFLLSRKMLGGIMRWGILILIFALVAQYISDWTFLFQSSRNTYIPSGYDDLFYMITYFITASAMVKFLRTYKDLQAKTARQKISHAAAESGE